MDMIVDAEAMSGGDGRWAEAIKESEATGGTDCRYRGNEQRRWAMGGLEALSGYDFWWASNGRIRGNGW
jgi:hypothetical protein